MGTKKETKKDESSSIDEQIRSMNNTADKLSAMLIINHDNIDKVVSEQPAYYYQVGHLHSTAVALRDTVKNSLTEIRQSLYLIIRSDGDKEGKKLTESHVAAMVDTDATVQTEAEYLGKANTLLGKVGALKDAFAQRSFAVRDIVSLTVHTHIIDSSISVSSNTNQDKNRGIIEKHREKKLRKK